MWRLFLRLRALLWIFRFVLVPLLAFLLALFVFLLIGWSLYILLVVKTLQNLGESPLIFGLILLLEILIVGVILYLSVMYINRLRKKLRGKSGGKL